MDPLIGIVAQATLLMILATVADFGVAGWVTGLVYALIIAAALTYGLHRQRTVALQPADWVTMVRATLVGGAAVLTVDSVLTSESATATHHVLVGITIAALILDAVDGKVARRTGISTRLGAIFDQEIDAFLLVVLSVYVARSVGIWVLVIGAMRYAFLVAGWVLPWLRGPLPSSMWGKTVAATQGVVLLFAAADVLPRPMTLITLIISLGMLLESFSRSVVYLWRHRPADLPAIGRPRLSVGS